MTYYQTLRGEFVNLRPITVNDASITLHWRTSARARLLNIGANSINDQIKWIESRPSNECNYIIELKNGHPIGMLSIIGINSIHKHAETARFLIGDEESAKGIPAAVEAMKLIYQFAFDELKLIRLYGTVVSGNLLMAKWQKYLGMKEEGRMRNHYYINDKWQDAIILGLLSEEYRAYSLPRMSALIKTARQRNTNNQ